MKFINPVPGLPNGYPRPYWDYFNAEGRKYYNPDYKKPGDRVGHKGVDLRATYGTPIVASITSTVHFAGYLNELAGYGVELIWKEPDKRIWWGLRQMHMPFSGVRVHTGQEVVQGELIGDIGDSGNANYPHTHFEIRRMTRYSPNKKLVGQGTVHDPLKLGILGNDQQWVEVTNTRPVLRKQYPPYVEDLHVQDLQHYLNQGDFISLEPGVNFNPGLLEWDGKFGPSTEEGVKLFQEVTGLYIDGIVGKDTWTALPS